MAVEEQDLRGLVDQYFRDREGYYISQLTRKPGGSVELDIDHDTDPVSMDTIVALTRYLRDTLGEALDDTDLTVSSAGLTGPLTEPRRYRKFVDKPLEVLLKMGVKEHGILKSVTDDGIELEVTRMIKPEGKRRKVPTPVILEIKYDEIKHAAYDLKV